MTTISNQSPTMPRSPERFSTAAAPIRCLVVDDHPAVRMGVRELLSAEPDFLVADAVATAEAAVSFAERRDVDVAVVDYQLGSRNGLWVSRKLKRLARPPKVLVYSAYSDGVLAAASVVAEADGLLSKACVGAELCDAIRQVARGRLLLPAVPSSLTASMRRRLDPEEQAIFGMLLAGIGTSEIAATMALSGAGLESRLGSMLRKLERLEADHGRELRRQPLPNRPFGARRRTG